MTTMALRKISVRTRAIDCSSKREAPIARRWWQSELLRREVNHRALILALVCLFVPGFVAVCAAQGCAMCYQGAAASGAAGRAALRHGVLILLLPAVGLFLGIFVLIYRRRNPVG